MITSLRDFARYFQTVRDRTLAFTEPIPAEQIDFSPRPGKFTIGDLIRHIAATEKMFVLGAVEGRWGYAGHARSLGPTKEEAIDYLMAAHEEATNRLLTAPDEVLKEKRPTPFGMAVSAWRLLMTMTEHEIHHRSQISQYLLSLGVEPPQVFGRKLEEFVKF